VTIRGQGTSSDPLYDDKEAREQIARWFDGPTIETAPSPPLIRRPDYRAHLRPIVQAIIVIAIAVGISAPIVALRNTHRAVLDPSPSSGKLFVFRLVASAPVMKFDLHASTCTVVQEGTITGNGLLLWTTGNSLLILQGLTPGETYDVACELVP
jgi:hypothetical protein